MKAKHVFLVAMMLFVGSFTMEMAAQSAIEAVVKKCETMKDVEVSKMTTRDKDTKKVTREITTITFRDNQALANEVVAAFNKDKANALHEAESSSNGQVTSIFYKFEKASYSYSQRSGRVSITIIQGDGEGMTSFNLSNGYSYSF